MIKQIHSIARPARLLPFGMILLLGTQTAQAKQCSAAIPPNPQGHWSYRFIDGRKCWYQGENMLSKSLLHWPEEASAPSPSDKELPLPDKEPMSATIDPDACCGPVVEDSNSFEARWRGLETMLVKN
jgi:hypothetical protein